MEKSVNPAEKLKYPEMSIQNTGLHCYGNKKNQFFCKISSVKNCLEVKLGLA